MTAVKLYDLAKVVRSKNAGPFELTLDILFDDVEKYQRVKNSQIINKELICRLYNVTPEEIYHLVFYDAALGIKVTLKRPVASGTIGDTDVYGAQQHAPLLEVLV